QACGARAWKGAARPPRCVSQAGLAARRADLDRAVAVPAAVVPPLRRLRAALDDPAPLARAGRRRAAGHARAGARVADAAPSGADAALLSLARVRAEPVRARGDTTFRPRGPIPLRILLTQDSGNTLDR